MTDQHTPVHSSIDVVFPAHNEEARIDRTLRAYRAALTRSSVRFTVALDGCRDDTASIVNHHASLDSRVRLIDYPKLGKGGVLMETFRRCDAPLVGFVDADGATPPTELTRLADACATADLAIATRRHPASVVPRHRPIPRRVTSAGFAFGVRRLFGLPNTDTQCGAKVVRREAMHSLLPMLSSRDFLFDVDLLVTARDMGMRTVEVPTVWIDQSGSRLRAGSDAKRMLASALRLWVNRRVLGTASLPSSTPSDIGGDHGGDGDEEEARDRS